MLSNTHASGSEICSGQIKILFVIDYFCNTGGTEKHLTQLITGLPSNTFRCSIVAFDLGQNSLLETMRDCGVLIVS